METIKVVYNACYGGFGLSDDAEKEVLRRKGLSGDAVEDFRVHSLQRDDPDLVAVVEKGGASGKYAKLMIQEIPARFKNCWMIGEYDGFEGVDVDKQAYKLQVIKEIAMSGADVRKKLDDIVAIIDIDVDVET